MLKAKEISGVLRLGKGHLELHVHYNKRKVYNESGLFIF